MFTTPARSASRGRRDRAASGSGSRLRRTRRVSLLARVDGDFQSLTLNSSLVVPSFALNGLSSGGVTASLTSTNNFINFCDTRPDLPITNGKQLDGGSCNPAPIGEVPDVNLIPTVRIFDPPQDQILAANKTFSLSFTSKNLHAGIFTNPNLNFLAAPQQVGRDGVLGHHHLVIEEIDPESTAPSDPHSFAYFAVLAGVGSSAGVVQTNIPNGLPEGYYRVTVAPRAANFQPVLGPTVQLGAMTDVLYISVTEDGSVGSVPAVRRRRSESLDVARRNPEPKMPLRRPVRVGARADAQGSLTLVPSVVAEGFQNNGMGTIVQPGQSSSATSPNNFINFCASSSLPLINGAGQTGFCNPAPMGLLPSSAKMPSARITYPRNGDTLRALNGFTVGVAVRNLASGRNANSAANYMSAPQQLTPEGLIQGHPYVVIEDVGGLAPSDASDPRRFSLFKGMTELADANGVITTQVANGLPPSKYKLTVGMKTANGQQVLLPVLQHGEVGDSIFFTVAQDGPVPSNATAIVGSALPYIAPSSSASSSPAANTQAHSNTPGTPAPKSNNVIYAVAGTLGGIAVLAAILLAIWFFRRRRRNDQSREQMLQWRSGTFDQYGPPPPTPFLSGLPSERTRRDSEESMTVIVPMSTSPPNKAQLMAGMPPVHVPAPPPPASVSETKTRAGQTSTRRYSVVSAAPSYHTAYTPR